jgi:hypothetical protein
MFSDIAELHVHRPDLDGLAQIPASGGEDFRVRRLPW